MFPFKFFLSIVLCAFSLLLCGCEKNNCLEPSFISPEPVIPSPNVPTQKKSITTIRTIDSGTLEDLRGIFFLTPSIGFICGNNGTIIKTTDGGNTWTPQNSGTTVVLTDIKFVDENIGYCVGYYETILKTTDGGNTWASQSFDPNTVKPQHFNSLHVFDVNNIYVTGSWGAFFVTNNGGALWTDKNIDVSTTSACMHFDDLSNGFVAGNFTRIRKTIDGGTNWTINDPAAIHSGSTPSPYFIVDLHYFDANNAYMVAENLNTLESHLLKTSNGGEPWSIVYTPSFTNAVLYNIDFYSDSSGLMIARGDYAHPTEGKILKSVNKGVTWSIFPNNYNNLNKIFMTSDSSAVFIGDDGTVLVGE